VLWSAFFSPVLGCPGSFRKNQMNTPRRTFPGLRGLAALSLSILLGTLPVFQGLGFAATPSPTQGLQASERLARDTTLYSITATASPQGTLIRWKTSFELDNVGFNIYRERAGQTSRINREIIPGSAFIVGQNI